MSEKLFNVVLIEPEIPQNTGNIGRNCVGFNSRLHLVGPLGFELSDKQVKRAGLDYWPHLELQQYQCWQDWWAQIEDPSRVFFFTTKVAKAHYDVEFKQGDWLVFGKETKGLPEEIHSSFASKLVTLPFPGKVRSFNLANAVSMGVSEAYRQIR